MSYKHKNVIRHLLRGYLKESTGRREADIWARLNCSRQNFHNMKKPGRFPHPGKWTAIRRAFLLDRKTFWSIVAMYLDKVE